MTLVIIDRNEFETKYKQLTFVVSSFVRYLWLLSNNSILQENLFWESSPTLSLKFVQKRSLTRCLSEKKILLISSYYIHQTPFAIFSKKRLTTFSTMKCIRAQLIMIDCNNIALLYFYKCVAISCSEFLFENWFSLAEKVLSNLN